MNLTLTPVGRVLNDHTQKPETGWNDIISELIIKEKYRKALSGIEEFSHITVLFWLDQTAAGESLTVNPMGKKHLPQVGVFATHSPSRPNPIGITVCRLLSREGCLLKVRGLDAYNDTPILDIKSYTSISAPQSFAHPDWIDEIVSEEK